MKIAVSIAPLYEDLLQINFVSFVQSNDFLRLIVDMGLGEAWERAQERLTQENTSEKRDAFWDILEPAKNSGDLLRVFLNILFEGNIDVFHSIITRFVVEFLKWTKEYVVIGNILKDLDTLGIGNIFKQKILAEWRLYDDDILKKVTYLKNFVTAVAVGGSRDEDKYQLLRQRCSCFFPIIKCI